jgi:hypothetical protein
LTDNSSVKLSSLIPDARNANKGTLRGKEMIENSLRDFGAGRSILIDKNGRIIAGNKTVQNAGAIGLDDVIVVQTDGTKLVAVQRTDLDLTQDRKAIELGIADNRAAQVSLEWDTDVLKLLHEEVDLSQFWTEGELESLLGESLVPKDLLTDEDEAPAVPENPTAKLGDIYQLGTHRLMCGNALSLADVKRLTDGMRPDMVFTDPPYGVSIVSTKDAHRRWHRTLEGWTDREA